MSPGFSVLRMITVFRSMGVVELLFESMSVVIQVSEQDRPGFIFLPVRQIYKAMRKYTLFGFFLALALVMTGCEVVGDIFSAGVYTGVFLVILIIVIIVVVAARIFKK